ncbi:hypothetical protein GCM10008934_14340 [Virgibacillus salarius]
MTTMLTQKIAPVLGLITTCVSLHATSLAVTILASPTPTIMTLYYISYLLSKDSLDSLFPQRILL